MTIDQAAVETRYTAALDARPSKGLEIGSDGYTALTDAVADIPTLLAEVARLTKQNDRLRRRIRDRYCGCAWCCGSMPPGLEQRGQGHHICSAAKDPSDTHPPEGPR